MSKLAAVLILYAVSITLTPISARADSVDITIPSFLSFAVNDVSSNTTSTDPFAITFDSASLASGNTLKISVESDSTNFSSVGGDALPASLVTWSVTGATGGTGSSGTLSTSFAQVYQSSPNPSSGSVDLSWTMTAPGASGVKAGDHSLTLTWKVESL